MNDKQVAQELVKLAKALVSGCEKLPEGPMRDNCEKKKKEEGKDKKEDGKKAAAQELLKLARSLTAADSTQLKEKWLELADDLTNAIVIHARKQGNKKVLSRADRVYKELKDLINELD